MHWIDALAEMKKNPGKMFKCNVTTFKFQNGELIQSVNGDPVWKVRAILAMEQEVDWVEVPQWKKVDYAEFMEWYCNPANINKTCKVAYRSGVSSVSCDMINNMRQSAYWFSTECVSFEIPNE